MKGFLFLLIAVSLGTVGFTAEPIIITTGPGDNINIKVITPVVIEAYRRIGLEAVIKNTSLLRSLNMSSTGISDGELFRAGIVAEQYPTLIKVEEPVLIINTVAISLKDNLNIKSWESLRPYKIAYERGVKSTEKMISGMDVIAVDNIDIALDLLKHKRVDIVITGYYNGLYKISFLPLKNHVFISEPLSSTPVYHYVNIKHAKLVPQLEKALKEFDHRIIINKVLQK